MKRFIVPLVCFAAVCGCGGSGGGSSPAPGGTGSGGPSSAPSASPSSGASHAPGSSPSPGGSASPSPSAHPSPSPSPSASPPPGEAIETTGDDSVTYNGPLVLVAPDGMTYPLGAPDTYDVVTLVNNGTAVTTPAPAWSAGGAATTTVTAANGATPGPGQAFVGTTSMTATTGTITAGPSPGPQTVYVYNRFSVACFNGGGTGNPMQSEFLGTGIDFNANGTVVQDTTPNADLSLANACPSNSSPTITFGANGGAVIYNGDTSIPAFPQLAKSAWTQAQSAGNLASSVSYTDVQHYNPHKGGVVPIIIYANSGVFVKLLITAVSTTITNPMQPDGTYTAISGAYEVSGGPPGDGF